MTLRELISRHPSMFYQPLPGAWFENESFMDRDLTGIGLMPVGVVTGEPPERDLCTDTVLLAQLYVQYPAHPIWQRYLWTADTDRHGQRVYVGDNGKGLEIHRHIHLTERFGTPVWR